MDSQAALKARIADVVASFGRDQMGAALDLASVSLQPDALVITLRSVTCPAEQALAKDARGRALLVNLYGRAFDSVKQVLEAHIAQVLERPVTGAAITVDPESGNGIISFRLIDRPKRPAEED